MCAAVCSDYSHAARVAARLNARFFNASGVGLEQGLLIHGPSRATGRAPTVRLAAALLASLPGLAP